VIDANVVVWKIKPNVIARLLKDIHIPRAGSDNNYGELVMLQAPAAFQRLLVVIDLGETTTINCEEGIQLATHECGELRLQARLSGFDERENPAFVALRQSKP